MTQKSKLQILDETVEYYSKNPRALKGDGMCVYLNENEDKCAVGRCMINPRVSMSNGVDDLVDEDKELILEDELKPEYRGHDIRFWGELQDLHDWSRNWSDNGLTDEGLDAYNRIKNRWCLRLRGSEDV